MKRLSFILLMLFVAAFIFDTMIVDAENTPARYLTKGLLMPLLLAFFVTGVKTHANTNNRRCIKLVSCALIFSFIGDMFLIRDNSLNFMLGIASFLLAHIFYILFFYRIKPFTKNNRRFLFVSGFLISAYVVILNYLFRPFVTEQHLTIPVMAYSVVLGGMLFAAINLVNSAIRPNAFTFYIIAGAIFFVASDSMIAFNRFYVAVPLHGFYIMSTYCLAQFLMVIGAIRFVKKTNQS